MNYLRNSAFWVGFVVGAILLGLLMYFVPLAHADEPRKISPDAVCASHVLFFLPVFEQSACGVSSMELLFQSLCSAGGGSWDATPGSQAQCTGLQRPKPKET